MATGTVYFDLTSLTDVPKQNNDVAVCETIDDSSSKKPIERCGLACCQKKLKLTDTACRCSIRFCMLHRDFITHKCTYDYKGNAQKDLKTNLVKICGNKLKDSI